MNFMFFYWRKAIRRCCPDQLTEDSEIMHVNHTGHLLMCNKQAIWIKAVRPADLELDSKVDVTTNELLSTGADNDTNKPWQRRDERYDRNEYHPEPQEQVNLLVEQVNWQNALDRVAMHGTQPANLQQYQHNILHLSPQSLCNTIESRMV